MNYFNQYFPRNGASRKPLLNQFPDMDESKDPVSFWKDFKEAPVLFKIAGGVVALVVAGYAVGFIGNSLAYGVTGLKRFGYALQG